MNEITRYLPLWGEYYELTPINHNPDNILFSTVSNKSSENALICYIAFSDSVSTETIQKSIYAYHTLTSKAQLMPIKKYILYERKNGCQDCFLHLPYYKSLSSSYGQLKSEHFLDFAIQIGDALNVLHRSGIVHGNINPDNIYYDGDKWFLGGQIHNRGEIITVTQTDYNYSVYTAPEAASENSYNELCDIFAFGVLLYDVLLNYIYNTNSSPDSVDIHSSDKAPSETVDIILKACAESPQDRWQTINDMCNALQSSQKITTEQMAKRFPELAHYFTIFDPEHSTIYRPPMSLENSQTLDMRIVQRNKYQLVSVVAILIAILAVFVFIFYGISKIPELESSAIFDKIINNICL